MKIPKSFNFFFRTVKIIFDKNLPEYTIDNGQAWHDNSTGEYSIKMSPELKGDEKLRTFFHEFYHHLFRECERRELYKEESLIEQMAKLTTQAVKTAKYGKE